MAATVIDGIVVLFPFQALAAILFAISAGTIQMESGLFIICANGAAIPQTLSPSPPHDSNFARVCRTSFFGATSGTTLTVGRVSREGNTTTSVTQGYMLDKDGTPINGTAIDWIFELSFVAYLAGMVWRTGKTVGARVVEVRVIDTSNPGAAGVPLGKAILRYLAMTIGAVPALALLIYRYAAKGGNADAMFTGDFFRWFAWAAIFGVVWVIVLIVQIARKNDPVYDRLVGTAVVRN